MPTIKILYLMNAESYIKTKIAKSESMLDRKKAFELYNIKWLLCYENNKITQHTTILSHIAIRDITYLNFVNQK